MGSEDRKVREFEHDGKVYEVRQPTYKETAEANKLRAEAFNRELNAGTILRDELDTELRKRKLWNDKREMEFQTLRTEVNDLEYRLAKGRIKLSDAKQIALEIKKKRQEMVNMLTAKSNLDSDTCEGRADNERFIYLFANSIYNKETGEKYFPKGVEDYMVKQDDPVASAAVQEFYYLLSDSENPDDNLPENKFLKKYKFANEDYQLVDDEGRLIDMSGKHIDENGRYIKWTSDTDYIFVDSEGRQVNEKGEFVVEDCVFLDDDGNEIDESLFDSGVSNDEDTQVEEQEVKVEKEAEAPEEKVEESTASS
jgi:hypothetical protein